MKPNHLYIILFAAIAMLALFYSSSQKPLTPTFADFLGMSGFFLLCTSLMIGPLAVLNAKEFAPLIDSRQAVGIGSFAFLGMHFWLVLSSLFGWSFDFVFGVPSNLAAFAAFVLLIIIAITSPGAVSKMLGMANWKNVQRLAYIAFIFASFHFIQTALALGGGKFNFAEMALMAFGAVTVVLQAAGAWTRMQRAKNSQNQNLSELVK